MRAQVRRSYVDDTIAAIATPSGTGAIAVVRLSGGQALEVAAKVLVPLRGEAPLRFDRSHRAFRALVREPSGARILDDVLVLPMLAPRSFTGENVVEIHCHGGKLVPQLTLRALLRAGARAARPGEFTERAFSNGKLDLAQAEAVAELIVASSESAVTLARDQLEGALSRSIAQLRDLLLDGLATMEVHLDFPEDDLPPELAARLDSDLARCLERIGLLRSSYERGRLARDGVRGVLLGKPNVGKSSLMNALLGRDRALVSEEAGTTRDFLEEPLEIGGLLFRLCDTAGVRQGEGTVEREGVERTRQLIGSADVAIVTLDASQPLDELDVEVLALSMRCPVRVLVWNKTDLPARAARDVTASGLDLPSRQLAVSALTGDGIEDLALALASEISGSVGESSREGPAILLERHHDALLRAAAHLGDARELLRKLEPLELTALELRVAIDELESVLGPTATEEVLDRIFSQFCIGK